MRDVSMVAATAAGLAVVVICSTPSIYSFVSQLRKRETKETLYEDADGKATPESLYAYSAKKPKLLALALGLTGSTISIIIAVLSTLHIVHERLFLENWLSTAAWALILFQAAAIASSRKFVQAYDLGLLEFLSCLILACLLLAQGLGVATLLINRYPGLFALRVVELVTAVALAVASLSIPRRPDVYEDGQLVDPMYTVAAASRFQWSWPHKVLSLASKKRDLNMDDLPRPDHRTRAKEVSADFQRRNYTSPLWWSLVKAHGRTFVIQWVLTLVTAVLNLAPQWVVLHLLRILEARSSDAIPGMDVWTWVIWLGVAIVAQNWVESYVLWLSWAELAIPIRAQLAALVFEKAMRRKDSKGTGGSAKKEPVMELSDHAISGPATADKPEVDEDEDEAEAVKKSKQNTVNLIGVDGKRISDFCSFQNEFPGSLFGLVVSLVFLIHLLGWKALLAGFSTMILALPVNVYFSKRYSNAQDRLMKIRDQKMGIVTEALQGIRQIKFSALEPEWENKVGNVRDKELKCVWDVYIADTFLIGCWIVSPVCLSATALAVYAALTGNLTPSVAFVSLGVFEALQSTLTIIPELTTDLLDAWVSLKRIDEYLQGIEVSKITKEADEVTFDNASIAWPVDEEIDEGDRFVLRDLTVTFPKGELSVVSGKTGTGKSLMLAAILGEVDILNGSVAVPKAPGIIGRHDHKATKADWIIPGSIAYVAQIPWIENATIRDNVTFGLPYDEDRYNKTIEVCALKKDIDMLSDGESTEIGVNGINLSGGQKWRVTLARAVYSRAGVLVLDDIFSAVDAHVGRHIFEKCLNGELCAGRTRILVTHHVALCEPKTKYLVELGDGGVLHAGLLSELQQDGTLQQIKSHEQTEDEIREGEIATAVNSDDSADGEARDSAEEANQEVLRKVNSKSQARKFVEDETREQGAVKKHVYSTYLGDSGGWTFWLGALAIFLFVQCLTISSSWWLRIWTGTYEEESVDAVNKNLREQPSPYAHAISVRHSSVHTMTAPAHTQHYSLTFYLGVYVGLAIFTSIVSTLRFFYIYHGSLRASRLLFQKLNFVILRAPLRWLDTVPVGRILNRFTADFHVVDSSLANSLGFSANAILSLLGVIVAGLIVSPYIILLAFILLLACSYYALRYLNAARPIKRLESTAKSPVFEQFGSALTGVTTIRSFDKAQIYIGRMHKRIDDWSVSTWHLWLFNRWMGWRMALVGSLFAIVVAALILLTPGMDSALAGFALAFALEFSSCVMWTIRHYANVELNMNAAERIIEYTELPTESLDGKSPPAAWPTEGRLEIDDLVVAYAPDLPPVLKGLTFNVNRKERVGVVGRTGAGKSSLTLALFRFLEARSGSIHIDGVDISTIKLHHLRSRLAIIPQDPVLFSGTVRSNLDPFDRHTDAELRDSLRRVHLISGLAEEDDDETPTPTPTPGGNAGSSSLLPPPSPRSKKNVNVFQNLSSAVSEGGLNLSQGQRQLLCLARAIVARPRVMVLDEATSAVDMATDVLIQRSIREEFTDSTLLVIAHRLSTIADFDRILVLGDGRVAEYGSPRELWDHRGRDGVFRAMCEESGEREKLRGIVFGED